MNGSVHGPGSLLTLLKDASSGSATSTAATAMATASRSMASSAQQGLPLYLRPFAAVYVGEGIKRNVIGGVHGVRVRF